MMFDKNNKDILATWMFITVLFNMAMKAIQISTLHTLS
jgi:hypothetical protein